MNIHRIAAIQMVSGTSLADNLDQAEKLLAAAAQQGAELAVLPETFAVFAASQQQALGQEEAFGEAVISQFLSEQAKKHQLWIVGGTIPIAQSPGESKSYAACLVFNAEGELCARYNKMHLFDVEVGDEQGSYRESDTFVAGNELVVVDTPVGRLGLSVCYDLRFPELYRALFAKGVDLIAVPSAFTLKTGKAHWLPLLQARAIENQCYIIGANQGGRHSEKRETSGDSVIINGWGEVLAHRDKGPGCIVADMDVDGLNAIRRSMPIKQHQRFGIVQK